jgi:hypothetical protein
MRRAPLGNGSDNKYEVAAWVGWEKPREKCYKSAVLTNEIIG